MEIDANDENIWRSKYVYTLYGWDISYFTGKFQCYMRYKDIPHNFVEPNWWTLSTVIHHNTGLMKCPVVSVQAKDTTKTIMDKNGKELPKELWLQDSTPMIEWFEERFKNGSVLPSDPFQNFFVRLVEDYADEWMWRPALHYRWSYSTDAQLNVTRFANEFLYDMPVPKFIIKQLTWDRQVKEYVTGDGIRDKETRAHTEQTYLTALKRLQAILEKTPFLLGDKPSMADFGFFASMFRHFGLDPTPSRIMRYEAPAVFEWLARMWNAKYHKLANAKWHPEGALPDTWIPLLEDIGRTYFPYLHANAMAFKNGKKTFDLEIEGVTYRQLPVVHYRVWCRERLQSFYNNLPSDVQPRVRQLLEQTGCWATFMKDGVIPSNLHSPENPPPVCVPAKVISDSRILISAEKGYLFGILVEILWNWHNMEQDTETNHHQSCRSKYPSYDCCVQQRGYWFFVSHLETVDAFRCLNRS